MIQYYNPPPQDPTPPKRSFMQQLTENWLPVTISTVGAVIGLVHAVDSLMNNHRHKGD